MIRHILTTTERNQARADVNAIKSMLHSYASSHPKKHRIDIAGFLILPVTATFAMGYSFMTDGAPLTGALVTLATSVTYFGVIGKIGLLKPEWRGDEICLTDLNKVRDFSPPIKRLVSKSMETAKGALTYSQLESLLPGAEAWLRKDEIRFNIEQQLNSKHVH